jgi:hypothetical protein
MSKEIIIHKVLYSEASPDCETVGGTLLSLRRAARSENSSWSRVADPRRWLRNRRTRVQRRLPVLLLLLMFAPGLSAQQAAEVTTVDKQTLENLLQRIGQLEARVKQLENEKPATLIAGPASLSPEASPASGIDKAQQDAPSEIANNTVPQANPSPAVETEAQQDEVSMGERVDLNKTLLRIRGFGDMSVEGGWEKGQTTSFSLGKLNLFVTSDISERFRFLTEIVFEAGPSISEDVRSNVYGVDVERMLLQYTYNDHFHLLMGRNHTSIGYYNTAYHDSAWFETAIAPPFLYTYEDRGGILPIHIVGVSATGLIPSGSWGLHYIAEVGNGRASLLPTSEPVQNVVDENNHKAFNLALFTRPRAVPGMQLGFSWYNDLLTPFEKPKVSENIFAAYAVIEQPKFEWLNEGLLIRHAPAGSSRVFYTPGFYSTISRKFGRYQPYFGFQYVNASDQEPVFPTVGWQDGPYAGLRYNANESVAFKLQYGRTYYRQEASDNSLALQVAFTF